MTGAAPPELFVEREALKAALQTPELLGAWYQRVTPLCFQDPGHRLAHGAVTDAGGPSPDVTGMAWTDRVLAACPDDAVRAVVRRLSVEPLVTAGEASARYVTSIVARLLADDAGRRAVELKRELGALDPAREPERAGEILADLMALESYRRELARVGTP